MKINFILPYIYRNGGVKLMFEYANRLSIKGHDVTVYSPLYPYNFNKGDFKLVYNLKRFYQRGIQLLTQKNNLEKFSTLNFKLKQVPVINNYFVKDADIVMATTWPTAYSVANLNDKKGKKFYFSQDYEYWLANVKLVDASYKLPLHLITTCEYLNSLLYRKFGVNSTIIFNGIDLKMFHNDDKKYKKPTNILFIDNGLERKNCKMAIELAIKLKNNFPFLNFVSFGHRQYHKMPDFIKFIPNPSDEEIRLLYCNADIFLFTSLEEGFATPPAEAMACKCVVITSLIAAVQEYSTHMESAIHVTPGDEEGFFNWVVYFLNNADEYKRISQNAYQAAKQKLDCWESSTDKLEKLFYSKLKG